MTKKHFMELADAIRVHNDKGDQVDLFTEDQIETLARFCQYQNPCFNKQRWLDYISGKCGPSGGRK